MSLQVRYVCFVLMCILQLAQTLREHEIQCKFPNETRNMSPCEHGCQDGYRGKHCSIQCYMNCFSCNRKTSHCEGKCVEGHYGPYCTLLCFENCRVCDISGNCVNCKNNNVTGPHCETPILQPNSLTTTTPMNPDVTVKPPLPWYTIGTILFSVVMGIVIVSLSLYCCYVNTDWLHICRRSHKNSTNDVETKALNGSCGNATNDVEMNALKDSCGNATNDVEMNALKDSCGNATNDVEMNALKDSHENATTDDEVEGDAC
ncbi:uncharacterized protein LOC121368971 [Gigantopelta aegis]|uniref:uncharacterized protein LOC121368971 n=1 Tax=Gigantopelta aegis TaxID=1735272 RepID=UPI001B88CBF4|nr:uncharacterized protein LOC121368971 [Gigantopelta aegis]